jgi:hypothetical protein
MRATGNLPGRGPRKAGRTPFIYGGELSAGGSPAPNGAAGTGITALHADQLLLKSLRTLGEIACPKCGTSHDRVPPPCYVGSGGREPVRNCIKCGASLTGQGKGA